MKSKWFLGLLLLVSTGCMFGRFGAAIPVRYQSGGICSGIELTSHHEDVSGISYDSQKEGKSGRVDLVKDRPARIPDPNPSPQVTWYGMGSGPAYSGQQFVADLTWKCLPDKQPARVRFVYTAGQRGEKGLVHKGLQISENAASPHGFDIEVTEFRNW
jgi:hypothetical protein